MSELYPRPVETTQDALLMCDYLARFAIGEVSLQYAGIAAVIRELMRRLEEQAIVMEREEAKRGSKA